MKFKLELTVGAFILMGLACVLVLAFASTNSADRLGGQTYSVTARFANTGELKARAPVKIAGVKIGEVSSLVLDPGKFEAVATLRLSHAAGELPADTSAAIYTAGLLGERYIGLTPGGDPGRGHAPGRGIRYLRRCFSFGVTHVPVARQTTTGGSRISAAESFTSGAERITLRASKAIFRLVFPTAVIVPSASM